MMRIITRAGLVLGILLSTSCNSKSHVAAEVRPQTTSAERSKVALEELVFRQLFQHAESPFKEKSPVYLVSLGEYPDLNAVPEELLGRFSGQTPPVRRITEADFKKDWRQVVDGSSEKDAVLFFCRVFLTDDENRAFAIGGSYAHSMSLQRYLFELRKTNDGWAVSGSRRWGGEGYGTDDKD